MYMMRGTRRQVSLDFRISGQAFVEVLLFLRRCPRLVRDLVALDNALPRWHSQPGMVVLKVPRGCVEDLPDALQVGLAVGCAR